MSKVFYMINYQVAGGANHITGYQVEKEIENSNELSAMMSAVARNAVSNGLCQSVEGIRITGCTLMNPGHDVEFIANEMLEQMFVEMYEQWPTDTPVASAWSDMYNSIKGIEEVNNG